MSVTSAQSVALSRTTRGAWPHLPTLLVGSVAICIAATTAMVIAPGVTPLSILVAALLVTPWVAALAGCVNQIVLQDDTSVRAWAQEVRRLAGFGVTSAAPPAAAAALLLVALHMWRDTANPLALAPVAVSGSAAVVLSIGLLVVLPLGAARPQLRGVRLWLTALHLAARWPARFLAAPTVLVLGLWAATSLTASVLLLVPAPVVLLMGAAFWTSATQLGATDLDETTHSGHPTLERTHSAG